MIERIATVGRKNTTGKQISVSSVVGFASSLELTNAITNSNQPVVVKEEPNLKAVASSNISKTGKQVYDAACAVITVQG